MPDRWLQLIRGPRPKSATWPVQGTSPPKAPAKSREVSGCHSRCARPASRGSGLECASGGSSGRVGRIRPHVHHFAGGFEESQGVDACAPSGRAHCVFENFHRPCEGHRKFWPRIRQNVNQRSKVWSKAKHVRRPSLLSQRGRGRKFLRPCQPPIFAEELAELRACVSQLRQENSDLRCELQSGGRGGEERDRKQARNLSHSTLDLAPLNQCLLEPAHFEHGTCSRVPGRDGMKGMRVGEASNPGQLMISWTLLQTIL